MFIFVLYMIKASNMKKLYDMIKLNDETVFSVLEKQNLKPEFFAFRWITLLLSQDFKLPGKIYIEGSLIFEKYRSFLFFLNLNFT